MTYEDYNRLSEQILRCVNAGFYVVIKVGDAVVPERLYTIKEIAVVFAVPEGSLRFISENAKKSARVIKEVNEN